MIGSVHACPGRERERETPIEEGRGAFLNLCREAPSLSHTVFVMFILTSPTVTHMTPSFSKRVTGTGNEESRAAACVVCAEGGPRRAAPRPARLRPVADRFGALLYTFTCGEQSGFEQRDRPSGFGFKGCVLGERYTGSAGKIKGATRQRGPKMP